MSSDFGTPLGSLSRYFARFKATGDSASVKFGYAAPRQVFTNEQERDLASYAIKACKMYFGITPIEMRKLAYEYANQNISIQKKIPESWH